jgi:glycosyltransferase involved in cell wall biosynthesis
VTRNLTLSVEQLYRRQPGGIGTYVRGLIRGLDQVRNDLNIVGLAPWNTTPSDVRTMLTSIEQAPMPVGALTRAWKYRPLGVPRNSSIVHATSMAGPYGGGAPGAVHSVAMHDLLWRDDITEPTARGIRFHEDRLALLRDREDIRIFTSSPGLKELLVDDGFDNERVHPVRLGVDDDGVIATNGDVVRELLIRHDVAGPYTLYVGTREPRKNLERLILAHRHARVATPELGPLVFVGSPGWGAIDTQDATVLGVVERDVLKGLFRDAALCAYVAIAEGWGLPPVEALHLGTRVVASTSTPSVMNNPEVIHVDPFEVEAISDGLIRALAMDASETGAQRRRASVAELTWANSALDHLDGWS